MKKIYFLFIISLFITSNAQVGNNTNSNLSHESGNRNHFNEIQVSRNGRITVSENYIQNSTRENLLELPFNILSITPSSQNIIYVNKGGRGTQDGSSWENAVGELADALSWARANNNFTNTNRLKIFISIGTYFPLYSAADNAYTTNGGRDNAFVLSKFVNLYGGFDPDHNIRELSDPRILPNEINPNVDGTILSGDLDQNDGDTPTGNNAYHVLISSVSNVSELSTNVEFQGLIIKNGLANGSGTITVNNLTISRNNGGAYYFNSDKNNINIAIRNNIFTNSFSSSNGGVVFMNSSLNVLVNTVNCGLINSESSLSGGGLYAAIGTGNLLFQNTYINNNKAKTNGGGLYVGTTANSTSGTNTGICVLSFITSQVANNAINGGSNAYGGGIYMVSANKTANLNLQFSFIKNNSASGTTLGNGGGVFCQSGSNSSIVFNNSSIEKNTASHFGGAIYNSGGSNNSFYLKNSGVFGNIATQSNASGLYYTNKVGLTFLSSAFVGNTGNSVSTFLGGSGNTFTSYNSLIYGNDTLFNTNPSKDIQYSLVQGESSVSNGNLDATSSVYSTNVLFADYTNGDYRLKIGSPVINKGSNDLYRYDGSDYQNDVDLLLNPRLQENIIDIGAYEFKYYCSIPTIWNNGTWSNGVPTDYSYQTTINGNYSTEDNGVFSCGCLKVENDAYMLVNFNDNISVYNAVEVEPNATLTFQSGASLIQVNDESINTGVIHY